MTIQEQIIEAYKHELLLRRREDQVATKMSNEKIPDFANRLALLLKEHELEHKVQDYVKCQFFALNYMPYLPTMIQVASKKGIERYNKYKDWYRSKLSSELKKKVSRKVHRDSSKSSKDDFLKLKEVDNIEEEAKEQKHNSIEGFNICLEFTTYWNPESKYCIDCNYKEDCKKVLKERCTPLYQWRMGEIKERTYMNKINAGDYSL